METRINDPPSPKCLAEKPVVPERHQLVTSVREFFEAGRVAEVGYLRPLKRNLVDIFVWKATLSCALDTANALFLALEKRGHQEPWRPGRETVAYVGDVAFGLTLYEQTEHVEVTYEPLPPLRGGASGWQKKGHLVAARL